MKWNLNKFSEHNVNIEQKIKDILIQSKPIQALFQEYSIDLKKIKNLKITITELDSRYAETDSDEMKINKDLFNLGFDNFLKNYFFIIAHEIIHWLTRTKEKEAYFNDPEEVLGFVAAIAYELDTGSTEDEIWNKIYPKVSWHFKSEDEASQFFAKLYNKAKKINKTAQTLPYQPNISFTEFKRDNIPNPNDPSKNTTRQYFDAVGNLYKGTGNFIDLLRKNPMEALSVAWRNFYNLAMAALDTDKVIEEKLHKGLLSCSVCNHRIQKNNGFIDFKGDLNAGKKAPFCNICGETLYKQHYQASMSNKLNNKN